MQATATKTMRIAKQDAELLQKFADFNGMTFSEFARKAMFEMIEDQSDLIALRKAMQEDDGTRISHEDMMKEFGL